LSVPSLTKATGTPGSAPASSSGDPRVEKVCSPISPYASDFGVAEAMKGFARFQAEPVAEEEEEEKEG
jgi:hypothetical protein